jgi:hypothetical protein
VMSHAMVHIKMVYRLKVLFYELGFISWGVDLHASVEWGGNRVYRFVKILGNLPWVWSVPMKENTLNFVIESAGKWERRRKVGEGGETGGVRFFDVVGRKYVVSEQFETDQACRKTGAMTTDIESWNGCWCSLAHYLGEVLNSPLKVKTVSDARVNSDQLV